MKKTKIIALAVAVLMIALFAVSCAPVEEATAEEVPAAVEEPAEEVPTEAPAEEPAEEATGDTRIVVDHAGNEVEIPTEIDRIAVTNYYPFPSVISMYLGSGEEIIAMPPLAMSSVQEGIMGKIYPELLDAETEFSSDGTINAESLLALEPDIAFYIAGTPDQEILENAGIPAIGVSASNWDYDCIETYDEWVKLLAQIFPEQEGKTQEVIDYSNEVYNMIQERVADIPEEERTRSLHLFTYTDESMVVSGEQFFGQYWATAGGGINVGADMGADVGSAPVDMEQIYEWDPEIIYITNFSPAQPEDLYNNAIAGDDWSTVSAVENERVYKMPLGSYRSYTPGVDVPLTLLWTAQTMYPDLFEDIDMNQEVKDYYKEIYDVELTDEDVTSMFTPSREAADGYGS